MAAAMGTTNVQRAVAVERPLPLPPAAAVLQVAESTSSIQGMLLQSVKDMDSLTEQQRKDAGRWPPITRNELKQTVDVLLANAKLPNGSEAAGILNGVKLITNAGAGAITRDEYTIMAKQFGQTCDALKKVFDSFSEAQQAEGRAIVRKLRADDAERVRQIEEEEEKVRQIRAKIAAEKTALAEAPAAALPRKKTLKELEEANTVFSKQQKPTVSLYGF